MATDLQNPNRKVCLWSTVAVANLVLVGYLGLFFF
jgi:hypothetical protein